MPAIHELDEGVMPTLAPSSSPPATLRRDAFSPRRAAAIAGAAYVVTWATSIFAEFYVRPMLIVDGDAARTASNIAANAQLFRVAAVTDLLTGAGVVILNLALYELLAPVHRGLARFAAAWRLLEVAMGNAIAVSSFIVLSILGGGVQAFQPQEREALAYVFVEARMSGYMILLLFYGLGSTTYMYLLVRSRYVPGPLALLGLGGSALVVLFALTRMLFPAFTAAAAAAAGALPAAGLVLLALVLVPLLLFEAALGLWLLVKGVRAPAQA